MDKIMIFIINILKELDDWILWPSKFIDDYLIILYKLINLP